MDTYVCVYLNVLILCVFIFFTFFLVFDISVFYVSNFFLTFGFCFFFPLTLGTTFSFSALGAWSGKITGYSLKIFKFADPCSFRFSYVHSYSPLVWQYGHGKLAGLKGMKFNLESFSHSLYDEHYFESTAASPRESICSQLIWWILFIIIVFLLPLSLGVTLGHKGSRLCQFFSYRLYFLSSLCLNRFFFSLYCDFSIRCWSFWLPLSSYFHDNSITFFFSNFDFMEFWLLFDVIH